MVVPPFRVVGGPEYAYMQVADHLHSLIRSRKVAVGSRLPGEQALADEFGVAIGTIRRALKEMRQRGLVKTVPSLGTFIVHRDREAEDGGES
jgi:DNA-binding GntR family transcriptional regulator